MEWKVHGAHVHVQYTPPESTTSVVRRLAIVTFFVFETGPYVAQADLKHAMCLHLQCRTTDVPVSDTWMIKSNA